MTPKELDWIANGVPVNIYQRPGDGTAYATLSDFSRFNVMPLATVRVPATRTLTMGEALTHPDVLAKLEACKTAKPNG